MENGSAVEPEHREEKGTDEVGHHGDDDCSDNRLSYFWIHVLNKNVSDA